MLHTSEISLKGTEKRSDQQTNLAHSEFAGLFSHPTLHILAHVGGYQSDVTMRLCLCPSIFGYPF